MDSPSLSLTLAQLAREVSFAHPEDSISIVAERMRDEGLPLIPLTQGRQLIGVVSERSIAKALERGIEPLDPVEKAQEWANLSVSSYLSGSEALRRFSEEQISGLVVVDANRNVLGAIFPSDLIARTRPTPRVPAIGGMATPFGVYLTTGVVRAGASDVALVTTGTLLFFMMSFALFVSDRFGLLVESHRSWATVIGLGQGVLYFGIFAALFRLLPISGTHAAEHQVVHAIERGEPLVPEVVRRMPRVHPRCGTNLAVGASLYLAILLSGDWAPLELRGLLAIVATLLLWRRIGALVQQYITTKPATERQLLRGIAVGEQLLKNQAHSRRAYVSFGRRMLGSGMFHVMLGSVLGMLLIWLILKAFGVDVPLY